MEKNCHEQSVMSLSDVYILARPMVSKNQINLFPAEDGAERYHNDQYAYLWKNLQLENVRMSH